MQTVVLNFLKSYWQLILLAAVVVVGYGWIAHQQASFAKTLAALNVAHQTEIEQVTAARSQEEKQHAQEMQELKDSIAKIQADYAAAQEQLRTRQLQDQRQIVKQYGNDADGLASLLADRMGFVVVKPSSQ